MFPSIVWFRQDLRLSDNPAFFQGSHFPIIPLFIWDKDNPYNPGGASQWWLHQSLLSLQKALAFYGLKLILRRGSPLKILEDIISQHNAKALYWNRCYDSYSIARDKHIKEVFTPRLECKSFNGSLLLEPWEIESSSHKPFQVFTPYWRCHKSKHSLMGSPLTIPSVLEGYKQEIFSEDLRDWKLCPIHPNWAKNFTKDWKPGEEGAQERLNTFLEVSLATYQEGRNYPFKEGTSKLSPYLHWGEISPRQVWFATRIKTIQHPLSLSERDCFLKELGWREFSYYLLYHFPTLPHHNFHEKFNHFPWLADLDALKAWQKGKTGYPLVDAGMRELWQTGYMHNRVRMLVGSFLVKNLLIHWHYGEKWFWDCLVDADVANNSTNWQWVSGSGADAAPYFRIFNPTLQGEKFDPTGEYTKKFVPELSRLSHKYLFKPWEAPRGILQEAGIELGVTYPKPIIDFAFSRKRALEAFASLSKRKMLKKPQSH